jgi:multiple sugar transport system substrate-binding protein
MRKIYLIILLVILLFTTFNCTKKQPELTLWVGGAVQEVEYWQKLIEEYERISKQKVRLVIQPTDSDQRRQGLVISLQARQTDPDVFMMDVVWIGQFVSSNWLEPLDSYIQQWNFKTEHFFGKIVNLSDRYDDTLYALPVNVDGGLLYYRTDLLTKYGYTSPPSTWDQLVDYSLNIQGQERSNIPNFKGFLWQGAQYEGLVCTFDEFISSNRGGIMMNNEIDLEQVQNISALGFMRDLIYKYRISPLNTYTEMKEEEVRQSFQKGNALFERNWPYAWKLHQSDDSPVKGKLGISPLPHFEGGESASTLGGWHIGISKYSDMKEQAWELVEFILSYESQKKFALNLGWNPGREDVYDDPEIIKELPHLQKLKEVFHHAVARPNLPYYTQISGIIQRYVNGCLAEEMKPETALKKAQEEVNEIIKEYGEK